MSYDFKVFVFENKNSVTDKSDIL